MPPPRVRLDPPRMRMSAVQRTPYICRQCRQASMATTPAPPIDQTIHAAPRIARYPPTQPPSYKPPEFRKSQLLRQYQSLLRSTPLFLVFQHNNLKAVEWAAIRRELAEAMNRVDEELAKEGQQAGIDAVGASAKLSVVQSGLFASALRITEFWNPDLTHEGETTGSASGEDEYTHGLSKQAWTAAKRNRRLEIGLEPLLSGPLALFTLPSVSPQHVKAALSILSPSPEFPAPRRRIKPSYHEPEVQQGLKNLLLLGARIEGRVFDTDGTKWVAGIQGGLDGLRANLVAMLSGIPAQLTTLLQGASRSLYLTMEGRKSQMEEGEKSGKDGSS